MEIGTPLVVFAKHVILQCIFIFIQKLSHF